MKRSRIFLGLTAGCLAVAGAVAAKVNYFSVTHAWYLDKTTGTCIAQDVPCVYNPTPPPPHTPTTCFFTSGGNTYTVYTTINLLQKCTNILVYTKTEN